ncbi:TolC family protein [Adonisia turfae]|uniref:TolC family protein n=1 Tax=Adonisia turfae TaxID=2950184 RepID=UPI002029B37D|nr:TolC family protein [Adonisia turfae]
MLTQQAIAQSSEIEAINQQLELTTERQDYAEARQWTNYLTMDPVRLIQNVLGGGDVQRDRLAIATLELEAANLIRRREEVAEGITREIVDLVLNYEHLDRQAMLLASQLESHRLQVAVAEARYRTGQGTTTSMIGLWQRTAELTARCSEHCIGQAQDIRELEILIGEEDLATQRVYASGHRDWAGCDFTEAILQTD